MAILITTQITGSLTVSQGTIGYGGFTGSLFGTSSWALNVGNGSVDSGSNNYLTKWLGSTLTSSRVYDDGNRVGIGTGENPSASLHIRNISTINGDGGLMMDVGLDAKGSYQALNDAGRLITFWGNNYFINDILVPTRYDTSKVAWAFVMDGRDNGIYSIDRFRVERQSPTGIITRPFQVNGDGNVGIGGDIDPYNSTLSGSILVIKSGSVGINAINPTFKLQVGGHVGPNADSVYDLGSTSSRWRMFYGTASYALNGSTSGSTVSASYALTASYALNGGSGGGSTLSASWASRSLSASIAINATSADFALVAGWTYTSSYYQISQSSIAISASWASSSISSSYALTASYALNGVTGGASLTTGSTYPITSSWAISASWAPDIEPTTVPSSSWASSSISSSYALTASYALNGGSGAANVTQSIYATQSLFSTQSISASYAGTASLLLGSVSNALTATSASWASSSISSSYALSSSRASSTISSSYSLTASYALNGGNSGTGGITGSGTINYVPVWTSTSSLSSTSSIYDGGTASGVSIGTTSSLAKLTIYKNGVTDFLWTSASSPSGGSSNPFSTSPLDGAYNQGKFVALDYNGTNAYTSSNDGRTWGVSGIVPSSGWRSMCYGNGIYVAVSYQGLVITSSDATNWATQSTPSVRSWSGITYGSGTFVIISNDYYYTPQIMTSPDGGTWTTQSTPNLSPPNYLELRDITYGDKFVMVIGGEGGYDKIAYSSNSISWTKVNIPVWSPDLYRITYGNGKYVATAYTAINYVLTSTDAITWITASVPTASRYISVGYGNGYYIAVGYGGPGTYPNIVTSIDAIIWTTASAQSVAQVNNMQSWWNVLYGNNTFAVIGASAAIRSTLPIQQQVSLYVDDDIIAKSITASLLGTASWAISASYAPGGSGTSLQTGSTYEITSSWAISASWAPSSPSTTAISSSWASSSISSSWALSASWSPFITTTSASFASSSISASYALTASYALNSGNIVTASLISGSTYEITSSWAISASWAPSMPSDTAISASWASSSLSASYAISASYAPSSPSTTAISASWASSSISASYALTASYALNGGTGGVSGYANSFMLMGG
jgi:hypothetical protein